MLLSGDSIDFTDMDMWDKSKLTDYLLYGTWHPHNAWRVIGGLHYDEPDAKDYVYHTCSGLGYAQSLSESYMERLSTFWIRDLRDPNELATPEFFIDYAFSRRIYPSWFNWAVKRGFYKLKLEHINFGTAAEKQDFDKKSKTYPPELDIAMQAWREVSATEGKGKPKARIKAWLDANTKLSAEAKDRISTVANWNKMGGATRSD